MSDKSNIEWCDATWNPTRGCTKIAQGCKNCYAETFAERWRGVQGHAYEHGFDPRTAPNQLTLPLKWKKPRRIFVDSMSDLFHEAFPFEYIAACFGVMAVTPWHTYQVLTKRPRRAGEFFAWAAAEAERKLSEWRAGHPGRPAKHGPQDLVVHAAQTHDSFEREAYGRMDLIRADGERVTVPSLHWPTAWPLPNVWIGTSIAEQKDADTNIPHLLQVPAAVRFLSCEPLIGPVNFRWASWDDLRPNPRRMRQLPPVERDGRLIAGAMNELDGLRMLDWVIVGGESGHGARPCNVEWIRSIVAQCKAAEVPVFVKQLGAQPVVRHHGWTDHDDPYVVGWPDDVRFGTINGRDARPLLRDRKGGDWEEWPEDLRVRQFPEVAPGRDQGTREDGPGAIAGSQQSVAEVRRG